MHTNEFSEEDIDILQKNPYTSFVSNWTIRFTLEFKQMFWEKIQSGIQPSRIFRQAGYDPKMLGASRVKNFARHIRQEVQSQNGLHEGYQSSKKRQKPAEDSGTIVQMSPETMDNIQRDILYIRQELETIKHLIQAVGN